MLPSHIVSDPSGSCVLQRVKPLMPSTSKSDSFLMVHIKTAKSMCTCKCKTDEYGFHLVRRICTVFL